MCAGNPLALVVEIPWQGSKPDRPLRGKTDRPLCRRRYLRFQALVCPIGKVKTTDPQSH